MTYQPFFYFPDLSEEEYKENLAFLASEAMKQGVRVLVVGNELHNWSSGEIQEMEGEELTEFIDVLAQTARENFSGLITYATDDWEGNGVNWESFDIVSINAYLGNNLPEDYVRAITGTKERYGKPLYITEVGSLTIPNPQEAGGDYLAMCDLEIAPDEKAQADHLEEQLGLIFNMGIDGVQVFSWAEQNEPSDPSCPDGENKDKKGYGITYDSCGEDCNEPKDSLQVVYAYYNDPT